jgi:hypothetical protein
MVYFFSLGTIFAFVLVEMALKIYNKVKEKKF